MFSFANQPVRLLKLQAADHHRRRFQIARAFHGGDDDSAGAVAAQEQSKRPKGETSDGLEIFLNVRGLRICAAGFLLACSRKAMAISANCSRVVRIRACAAGRRRHGPPPRRNSHIRDEFLIVLGIRRVWFLTRALRICACATTHRGHSRRSPSWRDRRQSPSRERDGKDLAGAHCPARSRSPH